MLTRKRQITRKCLCGCIRYRHTRRVMKSNGYELRTACLDCECVRFQERRFAIAPVNFRTQARVYARLRKRPQRP